MEQLKFSRATNIDKRFPLETDSTLQNYRYETALVLLIIFVAIGLRMYKLGEWSFWVDEVITLDIVQNVPANVSDNLGAFLRSYPTTALLIHMLVRLFGSNEWSARLAPALVGIFTGPILYVPVKRIYGSAVALVSIFLLALFPWHIYWSQNARFYIVLLLYYTLAIFAYYFGLEKDRPLYLIVGMIFTALAVSERMLGIFILPVFLLYLLLLKLLPFSKPAGLNIRNLSLVLLPGLIVATLFSWKYLQSPGDWWDSFSFANANPLVVLRWFLSVGGVDIPVVTLGIVGAAYLLLKKNRAALILSLGALMPVWGVMLASIFQYVHGRYMFVSIFCWLILAAYTIVKLLSGVNGIIKVITISLLLVLVVLGPVKDLNNYFSIYHGSRANWNIAFALVEEQRDVNDMIVTNDPWLARYYLGIEGVDLAKLDVDAAITIFEESDQNIWFVVGDTKYVDSRLLDWIETRAMISYEDDAVSLLRVFLYKPEYLDE